MDGIFDALAHPIRRQVLQMLRKGAMSAGELAAAFPVSKPTMSAHFAKLKAAGLIQAEHRGASVYYSLNLSVLEEALMGFMHRFEISRSMEGED